MKKALLLVLWLVCSICRAGTGYYVDVVNDTSRSLVLQFDHAFGWYPDDFEVPQVLQPFESRVLYTEDKAKGAGVAGMLVTHGPYEGSRIEVWQNYRGTAEPNHRSRMSVKSVFSPFHQGLSGGLQLEHGVGTNNSSISTSIRATQQGFFNTVYVTLVFNRFSAAASCKSFHVSGDIAGGECYNSGPVIVRRDVEIRLDTCRNLYGPDFNIENLDGRLVCAPPMHGVPRKRRGNPPNAALSR